jgi:hypothetical protein
VPPERPVRLTFPAYDMGAARIIADGKRDVGHVLGEFTGWRAYLWPEADLRPFQRIPDPMESVWCLTLREVRAVLRERVAEKGPWWA